MKKLPTPVLLIAIGALLTPLLGGQISVDRMSIPGGFTAFFQSVLGGLETPMLSHSLLALVFAAAVIAALKSRMIVQAPKAMFSGAMAAFVALLLLSIGFSQFRYASLAAATEWLSYAVALFGTVACVGRGRGPLLVLQALVTGVAVLAVLGLKDWAVQVKADPGYRLTGGWINPNAFAGMMAIGLVLAVALPASKERLGVALRWLAVFLCTTALMLTGSRAGLYASLAGILVWSALELVWRTGPKRVAVAALVVGLGVSAGIGLPKAVARGPGASAAASARALGGGTTDDSAQFRRNLFVGAMQLIKEQPLGRGVGTYRYYSAKPGLTTQTQLAHNNFLQTGVESGVLAVGCLVVAWLVWAGYVVRKASGIPAEQNMLRAGVFAAVATVVAQGMLESNLSYFGIGLAFHLLLGLGILVAPDAIGPEYLTKTARWSVGVTAAVISMVMGYMGIGQYFRARAYGEIEAGSPEEARNQAQLALSLVPVDAEAAGILATTTPGSEALKLAQRAVDLGPNTVALRRLSRLQDASGQRDAAITTLERARDLDPNNLLTLTQLIQLYDKSGKKDEAARTAADLIAVEKSPYFTTRSLADIVPTETYQARVYLASLANDPKERQKLLREAVEGYLEYAKTTIPWIVRMGAAVLADESPAKALERIGIGKSAANDLLAYYRSVGDAEGSGWAERALSELDAAEALLVK